jgi:2-alkyl-3-oxoalkanoate reductase
LHDNAEAVSSVLRDAQADLRVVHVSSMSVYGSATGLVPEDCPVRADLGAYATARISAEASLRSVRPDTVILRPGVEYGAGGWLWSGRIAQLLAARRLGDLGAGGDGKCNLVHVDDVAIAAVRALRVEEARGAIFNLAMASPPTWNEYLVQYARALRAVPVQRIGEKMQRAEARLIAPPLKVLEIVAARLGISTARLPSPMPKSFWSLCRHDIQLDVGRAMRILGLGWLPMRQGLEEAARYYRTPEP